jgi:capsular polysaccharide biosynthesis protein
MALGTSILRSDITVGQRETTTGRAARGGTGTAGQRNLIDFAGIRRALRQHWKALVASMLAGVLLAGLWSLTQTKLYAAEASGIVSTGTTENIGLGMAADSFAKSKATQYKVLAESAVVRDAALKEAGLEPGAGSVAVAVPLDTAELRFRVVRDNPEDAAKLANAYVTALSGSVADIENQTTGGAEPEKDQAQSIVKILPFVRAEAPTAPSYPPTALAVAAGLLIGLLGGLAYTALRSLYDRRIRSVATLEEDFGLSVVGIIPMHSRAGTRRLGTMQDARRRDSQSKPLLATSEAIKGLRTNLQFMNPDDPPRVICITSPLPSEGKSTVAANLAESIAAGGQDVVLIDGDLRRPTVARSFDLVENVGLTDAVVGRADLADVIQDIPDTPGMRVLGAARSRRTPRRSCPPTGSAP